MLQVGARFDRYVIEALLGEGGMGSVYRAFDEKLQRRVALKVVRRSPDDGDARGREAAARLMREARAAAAFSHPNVVAIHDVGEVDGAGFIAMELVRGATLREEMARSRPMATRLGWLRDVARALAAAHRAGLVHRDVKPDNVIVGDDGVVKVLDFGIARRAATSVAGEAQAGIATITAEGRTVGTPLYMAPEQIDGRAVDGRADEFAWGVMAYEICAGAPPWDASKGLAVVAEILGREADPIAPKAPDLPPEAAVVVMRALSKDPDARFATMDALGEALDEALGTQPPAAAPAEAASASSRSGREQPDATALARRAIAEAETIEAPIAGGGGAAGARPRRRARAAKVAVAAAMAALVAAGALHLRGRGSSEGASQRTTVVDLPSPRSQSEEARAAYRAGLQAFRAGILVQAAFERAAQLDPTLAEPHLQLALDAIVQNDNDFGRRPFNRAEQLRGAMSARDQALFDAIEPIVRRQPCDWANASRRLGAAVARFPRDAQLWYARGVVAQYAEGFEEANRHLARAIDIDPLFARAMEQRAYNLLYLGRFEEARRSLEACLAVVPGSTQCLVRTMRIESLEGRCDALEATARRLVAVGTAPERAYRWLAWALAARGRPRETILEALRQKHAHVPEERRAASEVTDTLFVDLLGGDFTSAQQKARDLLRAAAKSPLEEDHARWSALLVAILAETGEAKEAGLVADDFLARRDAWEPDPRADDWGIAADPTPSMLAAKRRAGTLAKGEMVARRAAWIRAWEARMAAPFRNYIWLYAYPPTVDDADEAREAMAAAPGYDPLPPFRPRMLIEGAAGAAYLLAGRVEEASAWLLRATSSCTALDFPIEHTHAHLWLGRAREAGGETAGACAAYRVVVDRWGSARPRSVTADAAKARMASLGCGR